VNGDEGSERKQPEAAEGGRRRPSGREVGGEGRGAKGGSGRACFVT